MAKYYEQKADRKFHSEFLYLAFNIPSHFHRSVEIHYVVEGTYEITIDKTPYKIPQDTILVIPPYVEHSAKKQISVKNLTMLVPYDYFNYFPSFLRTTKPLVLDDHAFNHEKMLPLFLQSHEDELSTATKEYNLRFFVNHGWISVLFGNLVSFYNLAFDSQTGNSRSEASEQILDYIDTHYKEPNLSGKVLAEAFNYNPSYLSRMFKKNFSVTIRKFINSTRIKHFIMLYYEDMTQNILTLAFQCGFSSEATFYRAFTEYTGTSPTTYFYSGTIRAD